MTIGEKIRNNFPNTIKKDAPIFSALISNSNQTGVMESLLNQFKEYCDQYTETPDIYKQSGEMLEKSVAFFTYLEQFTDETEDALKLRIAAIFKRNGDQVWGTPFDIKNVFRQYFPSAKIYLVENVNDIDDTTSKYKNLIEDFDFQANLGWVFSDPSVRTEEARFSKTYGVKLTNSNDYAEQTVSIDTDEETYTIVQGDTYDDIAKIYYGNKSLGNYIKTYSDNPSEITSGDIIKIPAFNAYYLHLFLAGKCTISIFDTVNEKYWNNITKSWQNESILVEFESKNTGINGTKAMTTVTFTIDSVSNEDIVIPGRTKLSDGTYIFYTTASVTLLAGETTCSVSVEAEKQGFEYNVSANTITTIVSEITGNLTVSNSNAAKGGTSDWEDQSLFIFNDYTQTEIKIKIMGSNKIGCVDYVRLYKKAQNPSFSIIAHFEGNANDDALALADGREDTDPITNLSDGATLPPKYGNYSYYDGAFLTGVSSGYAQDIYADLLEYVRSVGVKAYINIINRDLIEE